MTITMETERESVGDAGMKTKQAQRKRMKDAMDAGFATSQREVPVDRGQLQQSGFPAEFVSEERVRWGYGTDYALAQEEGTEPFLADFEALLEWGERVAGDPGVGASVWHKIAREGITPKRYAEAGAEDAQKWLDQRTFGDYFDREQ